MIGRIPQTVIGIFFQTTLRSNIYFAPNDGFKPVFFRSGIKFHGTEQIGVIGHGYSRHTKFSGPFEQGFVS